MAVEMSVEEFEAEVDRALDVVPDELARLVTNCVVLVEPEPPAGESSLFGLYEGIPLTERDSSYGGTLPDRILIFRGPILRHCRTIEEVHEEISITVVHEIAHHFGIDDDRLHELGYA
ncbi:metallopeptidase family protein [Propionibacteriaceae bacterium Y2011]